MKEPSRSEGASDSRSPIARGVPRRLRPRRVSLWVSIAAVAAVVLMLATLYAPSVFPDQARQEKWSAISLNFGSSPVSHTLAITFSRVSYINQPVQWNTTGFTGGTITGNSSFVTNSSGYGIMQYNSTTSKNGLVNYPVAGSLGSNVSYIFTSERVALNGTTAVWYSEISEAAQVTAPPTSGNVSAASAGAAQNILYVKASYAGGNYSFNVTDFEWKHGGFETLTTTAIASTVKVPRLTFFNVYLYVSKTSAVVSIANTLNATILGYTTVHPVLSGNLSKVADLTDVITQASGTSAAMILDHMYLVDHNTYSGIAGSTSAPAFVPFATGASTADVSAPFDPAAYAAVNYTNSASSNSQGSVNSSLGAFAAVTNSSSAASETSSQVNRTFVINGSSVATQATAKQTIATLRAAGEPTFVHSAGTLYITSWTPASIDGQIINYLQTYVSGKTGIAANQVNIQGYVVENITVQTTYSAQAASTIHNYVDSAIPSILATNHLALVNTQTGAIDAGADLGQFMDLATRQVLAPQITSSGQIFDPVNGQTYATPELAGFPSGSSIMADGTIHVIGQGTFLGFTASGAPIISGDSCFIVCLSSLSGAAQSVSNFLGSAATTVSNAVGSVTNTISTDVIQPVSGTLAADMGGTVSAVSQAVQNIAPIAGATLGNVGGAITSTIGSVSKTLSSLGGSLGSVGSGIVGAVSSGVNSVYNNVYHLGAQVGSAYAGISNSIVNTIGTAVNTGAAVISPWFASAGNDFIGGISTVGKSLASLGSQVAGAGMSALNSVGGAITTGLAGAYQWIQNGFGGLAGGILNSLTGSLNSSSTTASPLNWIDSLGGSVSTLVIVIIVVTILVVGLVAAFLILRHRHKRHGSGHERGGEDGHSSGPRHHRRGARHHTASLVELPRALVIAA